MILTKKIKNLKAVATTAITMKIMENVAFAEVGDSVFATGTKKLLGDASSFLLILAPIAGGAAIGYFAIRKMMCSDEMDHKKWDKLIKTAIVAVLIAETATALIKLFSSYYV